MAINVYKLSKWSVYVLALSRSFIYMCMYSIGWTRRTKRDKAGENRSRVMKLNINYSGMIFTVCMFTTTICSLLACIYALFVDHLSTLLYKHITHYIYTI